MDSRLPKPKILLGNSISRIPNLNINMNSQKIPKNESCLPGSSTSTISETLKKAKSVVNINSKCTNENKLPPKPRLNRSKTLSTITTKVVKRPATNPTNHTEPKKLCTRPTRPATLQRGGNMPLGNATSSRTVQNVMTTRNGSVATAKPSKWDLKGRLVHTSNELTSVRQMYKDTTSKYNGIQEKMNTLETDLNKYKSQAEKLESLSKALEIELKKIKDERDNLNERLKQTEEVYKNVSESLKEFKEKCSEQEELIVKHVSEIKGLQTNLEFQRQLNEELTTKNNDLQSLVHTMDRDRRALHNVIQEMKGNIRVFCRVRPRTPSELGKAMYVMNYVDECTIEVGKPDGSDSMSCSGKLRGTRHEFSFDKVFSSLAKQEDIFEELSHLVQSALEGYNVCVFAYGQTGSGKTYTMEGSPGIETEGMIPRTVRHIFEEMKHFQLLGWEYRIEASFLEIYNEHIVDLLNPQSKTHEIRMADNKGHDLFVTNLTIQEVHNPEELQECLIIAQRNRAVAATLSNERSSRSHSVARIRLIGVHNVREEVSIGNLNLVDLAGSERLKNEETARIAETKNINKSLSNLGNVILALLKKQEHVPYRNSKLTHLLMPSLGGNSKTLMLLNISPLDECYSETLNSLRFASQVNSCKTGNIKRTRTVLQTST